MLAIGWAAGPLGPPPLMGLCLGRSGIGPMPSFSCFGGGVGGCLELEDCELRLVPIPSATLLPRLFITPPLRAFETRKRVFHRRPACLQPHLARIRITALAGRNTPQSAPAGFSTRATAGAPPKPGPDRWPSARPSRASRSRSAPSPPRSARSRRRGRSTPSAKKN